MECLHMAKAQSVSIIEHLSGFSTITPAALNPPFTLYLEPPVIVNLG